MTGYKVVQPTGPKAMSYKPATGEALQSIRYRIGQTTRPSDSGPLAVFGSLEAASAWMRGRPGARLLEVEYEPSPERRLWKKNPPEFVRNRGGSRYGRGYFAISAGVTERHISECPRGTVLASAVTPLRVIADVE